MGNIKMEVEAAPGLVEELVALRGVLDELVSLHRLDEVVGVQKGQAHIVQQGLEHGLSVLHTVVHPSHHRLKHHLLLTDGQLVAAGVLFQLFFAQAEELLVLSHLGEVGQGVAAAAAGELLQGVGLCEVLDAQAVARVQLVLQELGAGVTQCVDLEEAGGLDKELDILCGDLGAAGVHVAEERVHGLGQDAVDLDQHLAALPVVVAEHGSEVGGAGGKHSAMAGELAALHADDDVGEQAAVAELVEHLQDAL
ncbi:hypothetical protein EYF80_021928 [Liparis tanakae]|uniref:Uncharacterized protein n=1 Tax=Liparis tanakae TaxID=230148 RepID=A0A4Z2HRZ3_9TELE|nr:hypothetical protein EYF80_021928 [Liparis tanakae]